MRCSEKKVLLFAYGEVEGPEAKALEMHLEACSRCRSYLASVAEIRDEVRSAAEALPGGRAPAWGWIAGEAERRRKWRLVQRILAGGMGGLALAGAAAALFLLMGQPRGTRAELGESVWRMEVLEKSIGDLWSLEGQTALLEAYDTVGERTFGTELLLVEEEENGGSSFAGKLEEIEGGVSRLEEGMSDFWLEGGST